MYIISIHLETLFLHSNSYETSINIFNTVLFSSVIEGHWSSKMVYACYFTDTL